MTAVETIHQTVLNIWSGAPTTAILPDDFNEDNSNTVAKLGQHVKESSHTKEDSEQGPFQDSHMNEVWLVLALNMTEGY
eukprot:1082525-Rhodomonas_salina.1